MVCFTAQYVDIPIDPSQDNDVRHFMQYLQEVLLTDAWCVRVFQAYDIGVKHECNISFFSGFDILRERRIADMGFAKCCSLLSLELLLRN